MPNRKTFDEREKYDHSGRPLGHAQGNDLKPDISEEERGVATPGSADGSRPSRPGRRGKGRERSGRST